jgi:hypothetical protein
MAYGTFKSVEEVATKFDIEVADTTLFIGEKTRKEMIILISIFILIK